MPPIECIELRCGSSRWLNVLHISITLVAAMAILLAHSSWEWKVLTIMALVAVYLVTVRSMRKDCPAGTVRLFSDAAGILVIDEQDVGAMQGEHAWVSRWICVFPLRKSPGTDIIYCMVCASNNPPDNYRQLSAWLRMRNAPADHGFFG